MSYFLVRTVGYYTSIIKSVRALDIQQINELLIEG